MSLALVVAFVVLMILAIPVGHALIIGGAVAVLWGGGVPLLAVVQQMFDQTQSFPMLALPFFMLAGALMMGGNLGRELLDFASEGMKRWTGGELSTTAVASVAFGGVSGSAVANASALGSVLIPWQKSRGYPGVLCAANNATSSVIDILIPPSIPMILYSLVSGTSVADLFIAGILPGVLMAGGLVGTCWWISKRRGYKVIRRARQPPRAAQARGQVEPGGRVADSDPGWLTLRLCDPDRNGGAVGHLFAAAQLASVPRPQLGALPRSGGRGRHCHRRRHAGDHGERGGRLAADLRPGADALCRVGSCDDPEQVSRDPAP